MYPDLIRAIRRQSRLRVNEPPSSAPFTSSISSEGYFRVSIAPIGIGVRIVTVIWRYLHPIASGRRKQIYICAVCVRLVRSFGVSHMTSIRSPSPSTLIVINPVIWITDICCVIIPSLPTTKSWNLIETCSIR